MPPTYNTLFDFFVSFPFFLPALPCFCLYALVGTLYFVLLILSCMYVRSSQILQSMDQPGKVANPARGQLDTENESRCPRSRLRIWSHEASLVIPSRVSLLILHTQAESGA